MVLFTLREFEIVIEMPISQTICLPRFIYLFPSILSQCLQKAISRLSLPVLEYHQALVHQRNKQIQHFPILNAITCTDRFHGFQSPASAEDGKPSKQRLLLFVEQ